MSDVQFYFFIGYLGLQVFIPTLRYLKFFWRPKQSRLFGDYFWFFSWTMKLTITQGVSGVTIFNKTNNETILMYPVDEALPQKQYQFIYNHPTSAIQYAKHVEKKMELKERNYGVRMEVVSYVNNRGPLEMIDKAVDLTEEKEKWLGIYDWYLRD